MLHYIAPEQLLQLQEESSPAAGSAVSSNFFSQLVQVLASVLDNEEDEDGHLTALHIIEDLMQKAPSVFLDHFARLGVFTKVLNLAGPALEDEMDSAAAAPSGEEKEEGVEEATAIVQGKPYHWKEWCLARGRDCLYLWCDAAALELSNGSNGWFRFILDGKLATMYSSGSPEGGSDSSGIC